MCLFFALKISPSSSDPHLYAFLKTWMCFYHPSKGKKMKNKTSLSVFLHVFHRDWFSGWETVTAGWSYISRPSSPPCPTEIQSLLKPPGIYINRVTSWSASILRSRYGFSGETWKNIPDVKEYLAANFFPLLHHCTIYFTLIKGRAYSNFLV